MRKYLIGTGLIIALVLILQLVSCADPDDHYAIDATPYIVGFFLLVAAIMVICLIISIPIRYFKARAQRKRYEQAIERAEQYRNTAGVPPPMTACDACNGNAFIPDINGIPGWSICFHCNGSGQQPIKTAL